METIEKRLRRLERKFQVPVHGRNVFFREEVQRAKSSGGCGSADSARSVMVGHIAKYRALPAADHAKYDALAVEETNRRREELHDDISHFGGPRSHE